MLEENTGKKRVIVNIYGAEYKVITDDDEKRVQTIAAFVDQLIRDTKNSNIYINNYSAAVLSCLNLSEELFKLKDEVEVLREGADELKVLNEYKEKLVAALQEVEANEMKNATMQMKYERLELENDELRDLLDDYKDKLGYLKAELEGNKKTITELQNKLLENQIELIKYRKDLLKYGE